jgi:ectoine hydroxylase-related dioxygenase (phytanoyl-CoA dioxygenase family)
MSLDKADVKRRFSEDGYAIIRDVLDEDTIEEACSHIDWKLKHDPGIDPENPTDFGDAQVVKNPFQANLATDNRLVEIAESILGEGVVHLQSTYFIKEPSENSKGTLWHQDGAYWTQFLEPMKVVSIWIALDKVTPENGCLRFIPGSHKKGYLSHDISGVVDDKDGEDPEVDLEEKGYSENDAVDIELEPGDVSVHRPSLLHAAYPNTSDRWRRAYAVRFTSTDTVMKRPGKEGQSEAFLLRGSPGEKQKYRRLPYYDQDDDSHMPFENWQEYNERARRLNDKLSEDVLMNL